MAGGLDTSSQPRLVLPAAERLPILAIDDKPANLVALQAVLAPLGLEVVTATSGEEALRMLLEQDFALILLDVRMPGMDGLETARLIKSRERTRETPIVFLTAARDEVGDIVRGYGVGAVDYVLKPFDAELLRSKVAVFAELEHSRRALRHSEAFLRSAFEAAPIGKTLLDIERRIVHANPAFGRMAGRSPEELSGMPVAELCRPEDRLSLSALLERITAEGEAGAEERIGLDLRLVGADGHEVWVSPTASWVGATELTRPLLLVQWVDVSARRRAERDRAELILEQNARSHAEAHAERLEKLQRLVELLDARSIDDLLPELVRRLVRLFDADAAELELRSETGQPVIVRASGSFVQRLGSDASADDERNWQQAPLHVDGVTLGTLRVALPASRPVTPLERTLLHDASVQVSLVVRRVQLHEHEHRIATELQRGLLPTRLPELPGFEIAAHCEAAGLDAKVGGDWYDAFVLPGERLGLVIGDVTGSGIRAASTMGQLRSVTRAFALADDEPPPPGEVLTRLHRYQRTVGSEELFTILYVILDRASGEVAWANAGHPPPMLRRRSGEVRTLGGTQPMMAIQDVVYTDRRVQLKPGDTLVLYTDGLVERRGEVIDAGLERLAGAVSDGPSDPQALCSYLVESTPPRGTGPADDLTAMVVSLTDVSLAAQPGRDEGIELILAPDDRAPAAARRLLERSFAAALDPDELDRAKLAISELATNAVLHGHGEITLRADLAPDRLRVAVIDKGAGFAFAGRPVAEERLGGWGLGLVEAVTSRWGMDGDATHVWFEIERGAAGGG